MNNSIQNTTTSIKDNRNLINEIDMLKGNINRMCVSNDKSEIDYMFEFANRRMHDIYEYNMNRVRGNV